LEDAVEWKYVWKKTKLVRISRHPSPIQITIDKKNWKMWNIQVFGYMMQDGNVKLHSGLPGNSSIRQEDSLHQQVALKFQEETSKVLHLEHSFV
jgi:hypothetical protein